MKEKNGNVVLEKSEEYFRGMLRFSWIKDDGPQINSAIRND